MTINELRKLSRSKFVEIGAHTVNHPRLSNEKPDVQEREILNSKQFLENILGSSVNGFSYPFGGKKDFDRQTMDLVKTAGYQYCVSTFAGRVYKFSNIYTLPRYVVRDWPIWDFQKKVDDFI